MPHFVNHMYCTANQVTFYSPHLKLEGVAFQFDGWPFHSVVSFSVPSNMSSCSLPQFSVGFSGVDLLLLVDSSVRPSSLVLLAKFDSSVC